MNIDQIVAEAERDIILECSNGVGLAHPNKIRSIIKSVVEKAYPIIAQLTRKSENEPPKPDAVATCPKCNVERADYEGHNKHLPNCPNCGSETDPVVKKWGKVVTDNVFDAAATDSSAGAEPTTDASEGQASVIGRTAGSSPATGAAATVREWTEDDVIKLLGDTNGGCQRVADAYNAAIRTQQNV